MKKLLYIAIAIGLTFANYTFTYATNKRSGNKSKIFKTKSTKVVTTNSAIPVKLKDVTLSNKEKEAISEYNEALDYYNQNRFNTALKYLNGVDNILGKSTSRTAYLEAQCYYQTGDYKAAKTACSAYFSGRPRQDAGFGEMTDMSNMLTTYFNNKAEQNKAAQEQYKLETEAEMQAQKEASLKEAAIIKAAKEKRESAKSELQAKDNEEEKALSQARSNNTREAYEQFITNYPYGRLRQNAEKEMTAKWPYPTRALKNNKYGFTDKAGKFVIKAKYDNASEFTEERARVGNNGLYGFVNTEGKIIIPLKYKSVDNFCNGFSAVKTKEGKAFFVDKNGTPMNNNVVYNDAKSFSEGLASVSDDYYKYGYINIEGTQIISNEYDIAESFHEGFAVVGKTENGKTLFAYITKNGEKLTDFIYEDAKSFQRGTARIKTGDKYGLIDRFGSPITCCDYDYITDFRSDGYARAKRENMDLLLDTDGTPWTIVNGVKIQVKFKN